ncbi:hypothetical protein ACFQOY_06975 [Enterococcus alcedinis]|uniref:Uncharacterized protein n=1 Tax=Enterococcus alcedinis TaxID=1274384 RepID=A0A917JGR7_9ENTE|nr:hypothetical protein [Enterococcus alcedinis]MBP2102857.1 hypothetical protein [Enterococcus alcedinis]GGI66481.1 hypothetical protein GCM10011482_21350 [Enterococcus alcedinis]
MTASLYVHLDTTSNTVVTQGFTPRDFYHGITHQPKNILLLNASSDQGEFEKHTTMKIIRGYAAITHYFDSLHKNQSLLDKRWIDFTELDLLRELTPLEISELLYFGHMKTHLYSPFFYKLQNNFVFFELEGGVNRTYYRYLDEFYRILALKINHLSLELLNSRSTFFRKAQPVEKINIELLKTLKEAFKEGVLIAIDQSKLMKNELQIPLIYAEDSPLSVKKINYNSDYLLGHLIYHKDLASWTLDVEDELLGIY